MSYVLEALRRAEAERHRGRVPGLDAQPLPAPEAGLAASGPKRRPGLVLGGLALAAGAVLVAWLVWPQPPSLPPAPPPAIAAAPAPVAAVRPAPPLAPSLAAPPVARAPTAPEAAAGRILPLKELPEATRRQLPPLVFGGATDSPERSARMLIINGQVWREGDEPAPGLTLERITLRSAQFRWRDQRFEAGY